MPTASPTVRRLVPAPAATVTVRDAYAVERTPRATRPWVGLCMVASLDGSVTVDGSSGGLGNPTDIAVLATLRAIADVIVVGAGTARGEGYGPPKRDGQRIGVVTNRGSVDPDSGLFRSGAGFAIAPESADVDPRVEVLRAGRDEVDLAAAIARLGEVVPGVRHVQAEGGPTLNGALVAADLVDELDLTWSPHLVGGDGPRLATGGRERRHRYTLAHLLTDDEGYLFGRWLRR